MDGIPAVPRPSRLRAMGRALRHRNYRLFFAGQLISLAGTWLQNVAQAWLVYRLTHSPALLGLVSFTAQIPLLVLPLFTGLTVDRLPKRRIIVTTQSLSMATALILAALVLGGRIQVWHIFVLAGCLGVINAFDVPARQAFVVEMVGKEDLANAIALNSSMFNSARIIGPGLGGLAVAAFGEGWCFLINALSYLAVIAGLLMMRLSAPARSAPSRDGGGILDGLRFLSAEPTARRLLLVLGANGFAGTSYAVLMPVFAHDVLHGDASTLGFLMASAGLGALLGALRLAGRADDTARLARHALRAALGVGVGVALFSASRSFWVSAPLLAAIGFAMITQAAASNSVIQALAPDSLRGRVMAVYAMTFLGMTPIGSAVAGVMARWLGAPTTVLCGGLLCLVTAGTALMRKPVA